MNEVAIGFEKLRVFCVIGVYPEERLTPQEIWIDLKVRAQATSFTGDYLSSTVDYAGLAQLCRQIAEKSAFQLLESLASALIKELFRQFPLVFAVVKIRKPAAISRVQ